MAPLHILFVSTPVGPLGTGLGGGVELTLANLAQALQQRGHRIVTLAPEGSRWAGLDLDIALVPVPGQLQRTAQSQGREAAIALPPNPVLGHLWEAARQRQGEFDVIVNFAYDWLPFYLTPFFETPIAHLVSMGSLTEAMDQVIGQTLECFPQSIGVHSRAQAQTFAFGDRCRVLANGFDLSRYRFVPEAGPQNALGWVGRIAPEKGLEDAVAAIAQAGQRLQVWGAMEYPDYWADIQRRFPTAQLSYGGFVSTDALQAQLGHCQGLLMTPKWVEAFGNVAIEALACGVPVVAYARGGPLEIIEAGVTGFLVKPDSVAGLVEAIAQLPQINRAACRQRAESHYSLGAMGARTEQWLLEQLN